MSKLALFHRLGAIFSQRLNDEPNTTRASLGEHVGKKLRTNVSQRVTDEPNTTRASLGEHVGKKLRTNVSQRVNDEPNTTRASLGEHVGKKTLHKRFAASKRRAKHNACFTWRACWEKTVHKRVCQPWSEHESHLRCTTPGA